MAFFDSISKGLKKTRDSLRENVNFLLDRGPDLTDEFWDELEEILVMSDMGASVAYSIVDEMRYRATAEEMKSAYDVLDAIDQSIATKIELPPIDIFGQESAIVIFVGINGTGKTTTVGKIAKEYTDRGKKVILGSADTFRAAAIEQLQVWADRASVEMVMRERGSDPASVCFETVERAEEIGANLALIDTAGRLHTSDDLMRELVKVVSVVKKRANCDVFTVLVVDATTGQNGMEQAKVFNEGLSLDGLIVTKLDGTAKGGIVVQISNALKLPIYKIGVGEGIDDLKDFDREDFAKALIGEFDERYKK